jgi:hypothetical protein
MSRTLLSLLGVALIATFISCADSIAPSSSTTLAGAFTSLPLGFQFVPSTFAGGSAADSDGWAPRDGRTFGGIGEGEHDGRGGPGDGSMMCGGVGGAFHGDGIGLGFGHGFDRGLFGGIFAGTSLPARAHSKAAPAM